MDRGESTHFDCIPLMEQSILSSLMPQLYTPHKTSKMCFMIRLSKIQTVPKEEQLPILSDLSAKVGA